MPNQNGSLFGLTLLSPILDDPAARPSHDLQIRDHLSTLYTDQRSPFALAPGTHLCRLAVLDDLIYVGMPACEEHLNSKYLIFETNCDADLEPYMHTLAASIPTQLDAIWSHCVGYPGARNTDAFVRYMKSCQLTTTFYFAAVNDRSLPESLRALHTQHAVAEFIATHQHLPPTQLQADFQHFTAALATAPIPLPGTSAPHRNLKTGGRNE